MDGSIKAYDVDTDAELEATIIWDNSFAYKNYRQVNEDDAPIEKYVEELFVVMLFLN